MSSHLKLPQETHLRFHFFSEMGVSSTQSFMLGSGSQRVVYGPAATGTWELVGNAHPQVTF